MVKCVLKKIALVIFYLCVVFPYVSLSACVDGSTFYTLDQIDKNPYPFCDTIFKEIPVLDFRIVPFYMQSFFEPKLFLMHPSKGLKLVPEAGESLYVDFKSMMSKANGKSNRSLADYGVMYYGMHRSGMDGLCVYYNSRGQCIKQCLPIPALRRPVFKIRKKDQIFVAEVKVKSVVEGNLNSATGRDYKEQVKEMTAEELRAVFGKSVDLIQPEMNLKTHEFETRTECVDGNVRGDRIECTKTVEKIATKEVFNNITCLSGLNYTGKGYYIKRYDQTIGGHRYFWLRLNKKKLVRHIYDGGVYYPCDDSMSYDLDNINMRSFVTSIKVRGDHYTIPRVGYRIAPYKGNTKQNLCGNSELYLYVPTYLKNVKDAKECIFGKLEYSSDDREYSKSCLYSYTSDDFQTFGPNRNRSELKNLDFILQNEGVLDGLVERNLYFEKMCVDHFPKYEYRVKKHIDGTKTKQYVYEIGNYHQCDFIKVEAWGGGQAGYISDGKAYSGAPAHYTLGILGTNNGKLKGKKLVIYVGEGGSYPGEYGEDTVVALCDSGSFNSNCNVSFVARGCTHNECQKNHSFINDDIVMHYRSATGMDFSRQRPVWLQYYRFIPWGDPQFPAGTIRLNGNDCSGPANAFEKNPNQYPGSGGCANISKSIQEGADGLVRLTCEMWSGNTTKRVQNEKSASYIYDSNKKSLCVNGRGGCLKSVCIYSADNEYMKFRSPVTMFGEKCEPLVERKHHLFVNIFAAGDKMTIKRVSDSKYCYDNHQALVTGYMSNFDNADYTYATGGLRVNRIKCWQNWEHENMSLLCYRNRMSHLKMSEDKYVCCYHNIQDTEHRKDICWRQKGVDILKMFNYSTLPIELRETFDDGGKELLTSLPPISNTAKTQKHKTEKVENFEKVTKSIEGDNSVKKQVSYLSIGNNIQYLKTIGTYPMQNNDSVSMGMLVQERMNYPFKSEIRIENLKINTDVKSYNYNTLESYGLKDEKTRVFAKKYAGFGSSDGFLTLAKSQRKNNKPLSKEQLDINLNLEETKGVELQYAYYPEEKTFCIDTTDKVKNKGCLVSLCIYSKGGTFDGPNSYKLVRDKVESSDACLPSSAVDVKYNSKIGESIKVSCPNDNHCCYHNGKMTQCIASENLALSCYNKSTSSSEVFDYTCCYSNIRDHHRAKVKDVFSLDINPVCWKVGRTIWQILGYYRLPQEVREQVDKQSNKTMVKVVKSSSVKNATPIQAKK
ncbi:hypothetical protein ECHJAX_0131 [Ehrlichia chaffeensis str. Jax]|nr:hypothetical protein ECHJAX_0131 [Ehrlichia chaffeensis str. Jax]